MHGVTAEMWSLERRCGYPGKGVVTRERIGSPGRGCDHQEEGVVTRKRVWSPGRGYGGHTYLYKNLLHVHVLYKCQVIHVSFLMYGVLAHTLIEFAVCCDRCTSGATQSLF